MSNSVDLAENPQHYISRGSVIMRCSRRTWTAGCDGLKNHDIHSQPRIDGVKPGSHST